MLQMQKLRKEMKKFESENVAGLVLQDGTEVIPQHTVHVPIKWKGNATTITGVVAEHAEIKVICYCARLGLKTKGATLYAMKIGCPLCAQIIDFAGIRKVVLDKEFCENLEDSSKLTYSTALGTLKEAEIEVILL